MQQDKIKVTYFALPGRGEAIRILLHLGNIQFEDERVSLEDFYKKQPTGVYKYNQLPVMEVNGVQYAQSEGMYQYAAMKAGLFPSSPLDNLKISQVTQSFVEILSQLGLTYHLESEELQKAARLKLANEGVPLWLSRIEKSLKENGSNGYIVGNKMSYGDVVLFGYLQIFQKGVVEEFDHEILKKYPTINKLYETVLKHPRIVEWYKKNPVAY